MMPEKSKFKKWLNISLWSLLGLAGFVLLIAALNKKDELVCKGVDIEITGVNDNFFINKKDIIESIRHFEQGEIEGKLIKAFNLDSLETKIKEDVWINKAELYFDNKGILNVRIEEKNPIARIFCTDGTSCYLDNVKNMLPLSNRHAARLPVFTGFPTSLKVLAKEDSLLLEDVRLMSVAIVNDDFLMAMIDQVDINASRQFEMIPKIGDQLIIFGRAENMGEKFNKLKLFYKKIIPAYGWSRYKRVNLDYKNQIVTTLSGNVDVAADSLKTIQMMDALATYTALKSADTSQTMIQDNNSNSTDPSLINNSIQRDEPTESDNNVPPVTTPKVIDAPKPEPIKVTVTAQPVKTNSASNEAVKIKPVNKLNKTSVAVKKENNTVSKAKTETKVKKEIKAAKQVMPKQSKEKNKTGNDY